MNEQKPMLNHVTRKHHVRIDDIHSLIKRLEKATKA